MYGETLAAVSAVKTENCCYNTQPAASVFAAAAGDGAVMT